MFLTLSSHRDINTFEETHHLLRKYLNSRSDTTVTLCSFIWSWSGRRSTCKSKHLELLTLHPLTPLTQDILTPKKAMWHTFAADYTPSNNPSHLAYTILVNNTPTGNYRHCPTQEPLNIHHYHLPSNWALL